MGQNHLHFKRGEEVNSLLLALQFFAIIPVNKNLPMERRPITGMYSVFPWVGAVIGELLV